MAAGLTNLLHNKLEYQELLYKQSLWGSEYVYVLRCLTAAAVLKACMHIACMPACLTGPQSMSMSALLLYNTCK